MTRRPSALGCIRGEPLLPIVGLDSSCRQRSPGAIVNSDSSRTVLPGSASATISFRPASVGSRTLRDLAGEVNFNALGTAAHVRTADWASMSRPRPHQPALRKLREVRPPSSSRPSRWTVETWRRVAAGARCSKTVHLPAFWKPPISGVGKAGRPHREPRWPANSGLAAGLPAVPLLPDRLDLVETDQLRGAASSRAGADRRGRQARPARRGRLRRDGAGVGSCRRHGAGTACPGRTWTGLAGVRDDRGRPCRGFGALRRLSPIDYSAVVATATLRRWAVRPIMAVAGGSRWPRHSRSLTQNAWALPPAAAAGRRRIGSSFRWCRRAVREPMAAMSNGYQVGEPIQIRIVQARPEHACRP